MDHILRELNVPQQNRRLFTPSIHNSNNNIINNNNTETKVSHPQVIATGSTNGEDIPSFFPLEMFDDATYERRTPEEWLKVIHN